MKKSDPTEKDNSNSNLDEQKATALALDLADKLDKNEISLEEMAQTIDKFLIENQNVRSA